MVDYDLALLYEVTTKRLKEQVRRNIKRFPEDFMFELNQMEKEELVAKCDRLNVLKHSSVYPLVFTEQGVAMLSSVLHSDKAIRINIEIMRAFARFRIMLQDNLEILYDSSGVGEISGRFVLQTCDPSGIRHPLSFLQREGDGG